MRHTYATCDEMNTCKIRRLRYTCCVPHTRRVRDTVPVDTGHLGSLLQVAGGRFVGVELDVDTLDTRTYLKVSR